MAETPPLWVAPDPPPPVELTDHEIGVRHLKDLVEMLDQMMWMDGAQIGNAERATKQGEDPRPIYGNIFANLCDIEQKLRTNLLHLYVELDQTTIDAAQQASLHRPWIGHKFEHLIDVSREGGWNDWPDPGPLEPTELRLVEDDG